MKIVIDGQSIRERVDAIQKQADLFREWVQAHSLKTDGRDAGLEDPKMVPVLGMSDSLDAAILDLVDLLRRSAR